MITGSGEWVLPLFSMPWRFLIFFSSTNKVLAYLPYRLLLLLHPSPLQCGAHMHHDHVPAELGWGVVGLLGLVAFKWTMSANAMDRRVSSLAALVATTRTRLVIASLHWDHSNFVLWAPPPSSFSLNFEDHRVLYSDEEQILKLCPTVFSGSPFRIYHLFSWCAPCNHQQSLWVAGYAYTAHSGAQIGCKFSLSAILVIVILIVIITLPLGLSAFEQRGCESSHSKNSLGLNP